jgi:uncharacterized protein YyaL (SSP411 family)
MTSDWKQDSRIFGAFSMLVAMLILSCVDAISDEHRTSPAAISGAPSIAKTSFGSNKSAPSVSESGASKSALSKSALNKSALNKSASSESTGSNIKWQVWSDTIFETSRAQNKLVILDLHAVWCHWCHVMDQKTYGDKAVQKIIAAHFIPVSVDQASRPDLANRYEDYGWPATVIYNPKGQEIKLLSGYLSPQEFIAELNDCLKHPRVVSDELGQPGKRTGENAKPNTSLDKVLIRAFMNSYDTKNGGWTFGHKYLPCEAVEYSMDLASDGDKLSAERANEVLKLQINLLDPVWGGMYQYSTDNDWKHAHFEKLMEMQTGDMRIYSLAYLLWKNPEHLRVAEKIANYMSNFLLGPDGGFYTSQDADLVPGRHAGGYFALSDSERWKKGIPGIDKHIYSRENGWAIESFAALYGASGDRKYLAYAKRSADWILLHRQVDGHFCHDVLPDRANDKASFQIYLGDNLSMGRAFLALYAVTGDRKYLTRAESVADYIVKSFTAPIDGKAGVGFKTSSQSGVFASPVNFDENVSAARFFNLLYHYSSRLEDKRAAQIALDYLTLPSVTKKHENSAASILLAERELKTPPVHIVVVGAKNDTVAAELFRTALTCPGAYKQTEFYDVKEGKLPGATTEYPQLGHPAAFVCHDQICSRPAVNAAELKKLFSTTKSR